MVPIPQGLRLQCFLNGKLMQDALTSDMIFSVAELAAYLSTDMTMLPGTVIMTGTPAVFLKPGDRLESTTEGIGTLVNPVAGVDE